MVDVGTFMPRYLCRVSICRDLPGDVSPSRQHRPIAMQRGCRHPSSRLRQRLPLQSGWIPVAKAETSPQLRTGFIFKKLDNF